MRIRCWFRLHKWHYYSEDTRGCRLCGRHEESDKYYKAGAWEEVNNHFRMLKKILRKLGIKC